MNFVKTRLYRTGEIYYVNLDNVSTAHAIKEGGCKVCFVDRSDYVVVESTLIEFLQAKTYEEKN